MNAPNAQSGATFGVILGLVLLVGLIPMALRGGETWELASILATALGMPVSSLAFVLRSHGLAVWLVFLAVPLNGALVGAIVGAAAHAVGWHTRVAFVGIPALWAGIFFLTAWWSRSH
jgi:hypothetical protein